MSDHLVNILAVEQIRVNEDVYIQVFPENHEQYKTFSWQIIYKSGSKKYSFEEGRQPFEKYPDALADGIDFYNENK